MRCTTGSRPTGTAPPLRALVFDFDGVVLDSRRHMEETFAATCREHGVSAAALESDFLRLNGLPLPRIVARLGLPPEAVHTYQRRSRGSQGSLELHAGVGAVVELARSAGSSVGLLTGKDRSRTLETLERFAIRKWFDFVVCGDDGAFAPKPSPAALNWAVRSRAGGDTRAAAMVGDSLIDVLCARRAGVTAVGAAWGVTSALDLADGGACVVCATPAELRSWLALRLTGRLEDRHATHIGETGNPRRTAGVPAGTGAALA